MKTLRSTRHSAPSRREQRREQILERAVLLFAREGYADLDLQILADDLGVGKGTLYRYFPSKRKLFLAAADRVMHNLRGHIDVSIAGAADPLDQVTRGVRAYLEFFDAHPEAVELFIQERAQFRDRKRPAYFEHREANVERWRALYRDLIARGRLRPLAPERITDFFGDLLYGSMFVNYIAGRRRPPAEAAEEIVDIVFHGILSDPERRARPSRTVGRS